MTETKLAIIGGSGLYHLPELQDVEEIVVDTPFGAPSSPIMQGHIGTAQLLFIARHGKGHRFLPGEVNYRANVYGLKSLGATHLLSICAVGSLRETIEPGHLVAVDQFIDRTKGRPSTFFGNGIVGHVMFADPVCPDMRGMLTDCARAKNYMVHDGATMCVMEGPAFSSRAESLLHRQMGADLIGMTAMPEAKLAREAELCYGTLALATDFDCWHGNHDDVTVHQVMETMNNNIQKAQDVLRLLAEKVTTHSRQCACHRALENAIMTNPSVITDDVRSRLMPIMGRVL